METNSKFMQTISMLILFAIPVIFIAGIINLTSGNDISSDIDTPSTLASVDIDTLCDSVQTSSIDYYYNATTMAPVATQDYLKLRETVKRSCGITETEIGIIRRHNEMMKRLEQTNKRINNITLAKPNLIKPHVPPINTVHGVNSESIKNESYNIQTAPLKPSILNNEKLPSSPDVSK